MAILKNIIEKTKAFIDKYINELTSLPIDIKQIIESEKISVRPYFFENDLSGILVLENGTKTIGYDMSESEVRQRFTQAHELGHYVLHSAKSNVFMDAVLFKRQSDGYTTQEARMEQEANYFAANILMPEVLVKREVESLHKDLHDEENVRELADRFQVSLPAMTFRLINLGLI